MPGHFHSRDIIEKIDWLARSVTKKSLPMTDWDKKSSVRGSCTDVGYVVMDAWRNDVQTSLNPSDDLKRKYEELQASRQGTNKPEGKPSHQPFCKGKYVSPVWTQNEMLWLAKA